MVKLGVSLDRVSATDVDAVAGLIHELLDELDDGKGPSRSEVRATTGLLIDNGLALGVMALVEGEPAGVLMLNQCAAVYAGGRFGEITELYVVPKYRSRGIAPKLIAEAKTIAEEHDWKRLEVGAPPQPAWGRTLSFYLREGFEEVGPRLRFLVC